ncbi:hypothetical protein KU73_11720 [Pectobacterium wasabiae]|uniref:Ricin B lectin domain-containing protein n=1 Tax=Pectobacterium wasabiae TaxID=55208 RepID=A0AAW3EN71_9GAMM|nr:hypothetical protein A7983_12355 [Pectobacterium wasabiae CFBP 3304]KFX08655.1 hypothetical protein JV38_08000 [Pectobacterium wasabiae]KGA28682.1 hypothetical protein KU73_11720 [Pectobacterium wasabiae]
MRQENRQTYFLNKIPSNTADSATHYLNPGRKTAMWLSCAGNKQGNEAWHLSDINFTHQNNCLVKY